MSAPHTDTRVETIIEKAEYMESCLTLLSRTQPIGYDAYVGDVQTRDFVERRFEKLTGAALDIARMLVKDIEGNAPNSNAAAMECLSDVGVLSSPVASEMAEAALFRNVLAHEYGDVLDHETVYEALQDLERYRSFLYEIRDYLENVDAL
ncbi:type VII toxin-antitoxin system HepT family RNase toxin [Halovivax cerinus]|uniref:DUF86 domain-containing protein n=1 Tax=Halovivax cerinus TaxID=1487865 RepID=A0ABD5NNW1_9EURY|nr:DUF86 domain-containing protein [Halovivax cerinus]